MGLTGLYGFRKADRLVMPALVFRAEQPEDIAAIEQLIEDAFAPHPQSTHNEHLIVAALRRANALTLSLVAEQAGQIIGYIALSHVTITDDSSDWYGLGPLAVSPFFQGQGIGRGLVVNALFRLRQAKAQGCVVLGNPEFYSRFGFASKPDLNLPGFPVQNFLALAFEELSATGDVSYHQAFYL